MVPKIDGTSAAVLPQGQFLRAGEVARRLSISRTAAYRLMRESLPVYWFGPGAVRVLDADLESFIQRQRAEHASAALQGEA